MTGKSLISVIHILPTPVILADVAGLDGYPPKGHDAMLAGTRHASFMIRLLPNLLGWPTLKQPRGWLCNFSQSLFISAVRFCLICGKHITCEVSRGYRARDSACFDSPTFYLFNSYSVCCSVAVRRNFIGVTFVIYLIPDYVLSRKLLSIKNILCIPLQ